MNVHFRSVVHDSHEISMGHALWFEPVPGCDAISATANVVGFTPLTAVARHYGWDYEVLREASMRCNGRGEVCIVSTNPTLLLVPATRGQGNANFLISDLIAATKATNVKALHFTHFGFMQGHLPKLEVTSILDFLFSNMTTLGLSKLVVDIDARKEKEFYKMLMPCARRPPGFE